MGADIASHSVCGYHGDGEVDSPRTIGCQANTKGRHVSIRVAKDDVDNRTLTLCEVVVIGNQIRGGCP